MQRTFHGQYLPAGFDGPDSTSEALAWASATAPAAASASARCQIVTPPPHSPPRDSVENRCGHAAKNLREFTKKLRDIKSVSLIHSGERNDPLRSVAINHGYMIGSDLSRIGGNDAGSCSAQLASDDGIADGGGSEAGRITPIRAGNAPDDPDRAGGDQGIDRAGAAAPAYDASIPPPELNSPLAREGARLAADMRAVAVPLCLACLGMARGAHWLGGCRFCSRGQPAQ
jgi:hypothetical protein